MRNTLPSSLFSPTQLKSNVDKFFEKYEGCISSHDYKGADDEKLTALAKKIRGE